MEILIINNYETVLDKEITKKDIINLGGKITLITLALLTIKVTPSICMVAPKILPKVALEGYFYIVERAVEMYYNSEVTYVLELADELGKLMLKGVKELVVPAGAGVIKRNVHPSKLVSDVVFLRTVLKNWFGIF